MKGNTDALVTAFYDSESPCYLRPTQMEDKGSLTTEMAVRALRPFRLDFGNHMVFQRPCVVSMEIMNVTDIPVHWELYR
jgi:hypothetical protein